MNHIVENVLHGSRVRLDTHMEGWSYHHLQDGHFGKFALGLQQPVTRPWEVLCFRNGEAQAKDRGYMGCRGGVFIIERRRKLSSGTGSSSHRDQLTVHAPQFVRDLMDLATRYFRCVVQTTSIQFVIYL